MIELLESEKLTFLNLTSELSAASFIRCGSGGQQQIAAETFPGIEPRACAGEPCVLGQSSDAGQVVFVRVLRVDQLAGFKLHFEIELFDSHHLLAQTLDVDFDPADAFVVESAMTKLVQVERTAELAIDARKYVEIECRRDAECIV